MPSTRTRCSLLFLAVLALGAVALIAWFGGQPPATDDAELAQAMDVPAGEVQLETLPPRDMATRQEIGSDVPEAPAVTEAIDGADPVPTEGFGSIHGRVVDRNGDRIPAFKILWWREGASGYEQRSFKSAYGRFEIGQVRWGTWHVRAFAGELGGSAPTPTQVPYHEDLVLIIRDDIVIAGTVLQVNGTPAPGAEVFWRRDGQPRHEGVMLADPDGHFRLETASGKVNLEARWESQLTEEPLRYIAAPGFVDGDAELQLVLGGRLVVTVLDGEGRPDPGRKIFLERLLPQRWSPQWPRSARCDPLGEFDFGALLAGPYQVRAGDSERAAASGAPPSTPEVTPTASVEIVAGEATRVVLGGRSDRQVAVHGLLTRMGRPVAGEVTAFPEGPTALRDSREARVDGRGHFEMILEAPGTHVLQLRPRDGGRVKVRVVIPPVASHDLHLELPGGHISGVLLRGDRPTRQGYPIALQDRGVVDHLGSEWISFVETDSEGRWSFDGLAAGSYSIFASYPGYNNGNPAEMGIGRLEKIQLSEGERVENLQLEFGEIGSVHCRVTDHAGQPVEGAAIFARDLEGEWVYSNARASTLGDGWAYSPMPTGRYTFVARAAEGISPESEPVEVKALEPYRREFPTVELRLAPGGGLKASLLDADGTPVRARFMVHDSKGREQTGTTCTHDRARVLEHGFRSDQLWLRPLLPGDYRVTATAPDGRQATTDVTLRAGDDEALELKLE